MVTHLEKIQAFIASSNFGNDCVEWSHCIRHDGYGEVRYPDKTKAIVSRVAMSYYLGRKLDRSELVCHHCDNRKCYNPKHLFLGSDKDNSDDKISKQRHAFGERHGLTSLTREQVNFIKESLILKTYKAVELAKMFSVSQATISNIKKGKTWLAP